MPTGKPAGKIKGQEYLRFRCSGCGSCCALWIPVTDADVRRLEGVGYSPGKIVHFVSSSRIETEAGTIVWIKLGSGQAGKKAMCLREKRGQCIFLKGKRCEVYESRPVVCREHPFVVGLDKSGRRLRFLKLNQASACAHTLDGKISRRDLKKIYRLNLKQDENYLAKVKRWNRRKEAGSEKDFLRFLGFEV